MPKLGRPQPSHVASFATQAAGSVAIAVVHAEEVAERPCIIGGDRWLAKERFRKRIDALFRAQASATSGPESAPLAPTTSVVQIEYRKSRFARFGPCMIPSLEPRLESLGLPSDVRHSQPDLCRAVVVLRIHDTLSSPTCISTILMNPFEGVGVLELNPSLAFPLIECLLGGGKVKPLVVTREMTKIEERILSGLLTLILQNLSLSWQSVATVNFTVDSHES